MIKDNVTAGGDEEDNDTNSHKIGKTNTSTHTFHVWNPSCNKTVMTGMNNIVDR